MQSHRCVLILSLLFAAVQAAPKPLQDEWAEEREMAQQIIQPVPHMNAELETSFWAWGFQTYVLKFRALGEVREFSMPCFRKLRPQDFDQVVPRWDR